MRLRSSDTLSGLELAPAVFIQYFSCPLLLHLVVLDSFVHNCLETRTQSSFNAPKGVADWRLRTLNEYVFELRVPDRTFSWIGVIPSQPARLLADGISSCDKIFLHYVILNARLLDNTATFVYVGQLALCFLKPFSRIIVAGKVLHLLNAFD